MSYDLQTRVLERPCGSSSTAVDEYDRQRRGSGDVARQRNETVMLPTDVRETSEYQAVNSYLLKSRELALGRPGGLSEPHPSSADRRIVVTGAVIDEPASVPRTAVYSRLNTYTVPVGSIALLMFDDGSPHENRACHDCLSW
ncbi:hypothetical protein ACFV8T_41365 [Streptomyces sp. NPDC059832]|uniref:hypothetical protein n=1 Tax=unclassified Streptomyces TaxID=2593676 RepID=UPI00366975E7